MVLIGPYPGSTMIRAHQLVLWTTKADRLQASIAHVISLVVGRLPEPANEAGSLGTARGLRNVPSSAFQCLRLGGAPPTNHYSPRMRSRAELCDPTIWSFIIHFPSRQHRQLSNH
jgi:hypothetical protein